MADLQKIFDVVQSTYGAFQESVGESGEEFRDGRTIRYKATGYMYRWELYFKVEAVDVVTGINVEVDDYQSRSRAIDVAINQVLEEVKVQSVSSASASVPLRQAVVVKQLNLVNLEKALVRVPLTLSTTSSLGRALNVPDYKITEFSTNHPRDIAYVRTEILRYWLENNTCSWGAVTGALYIIGERQLAEEIRMYRDNPVD